MHGRLISVRLDGTVTRGITATSHRREGSYFRAIAVSRTLARHTQQVHVSNQPLVPLILKGLALTMRVAAVVLSILGTGSPNSHITLLGLGLFSLAVWALQEGQ